MPQQGGSSMFKFGYSAGFMRGLIVAAQIPLDMVEPAAWKKTARLPNKSDKEVCIPRACELWPNQVEELTPKRGHWTKEECKGVCDAALIGYHGLSLLGLLNDKPVDNEFDF
jgi:crossover junction endodeoxyribonuclease RuvC